jgi:hypothetical protein
MQEEQPQAREEGDQRNDVLKCSALCTGGFLAVKKFISFSLGPHHEIMNRRTEVYIS